MDQGLTPAQIESLRPLLESMIEESLRAAQLAAASVKVSTGTVSSVDGSDAWVIPDDDPENEMQVTRAAAAHDDGARVFIITYPPSGAFILPAVPDP